MAFTDLAFPGVSMNGQTLASGWAFIGHSILEHSHLAACNAGLNARSPVIQNCGPHGGYDVLISSVNSGVIAISFFIYFSLCAG